MITFMEAREKPLFAPSTSHQGVRQQRSRSAGEQPPERAWVATGIIDGDGNRCRVADERALAIVAVSVNEGCAPEIEERIDLMRDVVREVERSKRIPAGVLSLWVYPGGYFGFDALEYSNGDKAKAWSGLDPDDINKRLVEIVKVHPPGAWIVFGVDLGSEINKQQAWLVRGDGSKSGCVSILRMILRNQTSLSDRCCALDDRGLRAAFFVCGEIAAYNGQLSDCRLIVDLAHLRVPGTVRCDYAGARMLHQRAFEEEAGHCSAVLAHHHIGEKTAAGTDHFMNQSNWIMFRGDKPAWLDSSEVETIK